MEDDSSQTIHMADYIGCTVTVASFWPTAINTVLADTTDYHAKTVALYSPHNNIHTHHTTNMSTTHASPFAFVTVLSSPYVDQARLASDIEHQLLDKH